MARTCLLTLGVFCTALRGHEKLCEHCKGFKRLVAVQASVQEAEIKVSRLLEAKLFATFPRDVAKCTEREPAHALLQSESELATLQTQAYTEWDMPHAAVMNRASLQLW